jgi:lipooligosaccharide transport system permease protein
MDSELRIQRGKRFGAWYVAEHRIRGMTKWLGAIVTTSFANPIIYLLAVGVGVGTLVDANAGESGINGVNYLTFLAPALLATAAIQATMDETSFPTLEGFVWNKSFFGMNSTQLSAAQIVDGVMIAAFIRAVLTTGAYLLALLGFGAVELESIPILFFVACIAGLSFGSLILAATSFVTEDDGFFAVVHKFIVAPMFLFSGTFYPLDQMPLFLQWIGWISPLWHATNLSRAWSYGLDVPGWLILIHLGVLSLTFVAGMIIARRQFARRLLK